jgi:hypothetical protein
MGEEGSDSLFLSLFEEATGEAAGEAAAPSASVRHPPPEDDGLPDAVSLEEIARAEGSVELEALADRWQARHDGLIRFYGPLLELLAAGKTSAPVEDLRQAGRSGQALADAFLSLSDPRADVFAEAAAGLLARIPERQARGSESSGVDKPMPAPSRPTGQRPAPRRPAPRPSKDESPHTARLLSGVIALAVLTGVLLLWSGGGVSPADVAVYQDTVPEVLSKRMSGDLLLIEVSYDWDRLLRDQQLDSVMRLMEAASGEPYNTMRVQVHDGQLRAEVLADGSIELSGHRRRGTP